MVSRPNRGAFAALLVLATTGLAGCGEITVPAWINIVEPESSLTMTLLGTPIDVAVEGGFYAEIVVNTNSLATGKLKGLVRVPQIRIAGRDDGRVLKTLCIWKNTDVIAPGSLEVDVLAGTSSLVLPLALRASTSNVPLRNLLLQTTGSEFFELEPELGALPLSIDPQAIVDALVRGTVAGLFELPLSLAADIDAGGLPVNVSADLLVASSDSLPDFEPENVEECEQYWDLQGQEKVFPINPKGTYVRTFLDAPAPPTAVELASIGAAPGDTLRFIRKGTYTGWIGSGNFTNVVGLFTSSLWITPFDLFNHNQVPGAIDAGGPEGWTPSTAAGNWWTDITQDFALPDSVDLVVPPGATHVLFTVGDPWFADNFSNGLRVEILVNP